MSWASGLAIYFVIWWMSLFISLPFAMRSQAEVGEVTDGTEPGAPAQPQLLRRFLWNTVLATSVFGLFWFVFYYLDISMTDLPRIPPTSERPVTD